MELCPGLAQLSGLAASSGASWAAEADSGQWWVPLAPLGPDSRGLLGRVICVSAPEAAAPWQALGAQGQPVPRGAASRAPALGRMPGAQGEPSWLWA